MTEEVALTKIFNKCKLLNNEVEFLGWDSGKFENNSSKLILKNTITEEVWNSTSFGNFINKRTHITQSRHFYKNRKESLKRRNSEEEMLLRIKFLHKDKNWDYSKFHYNGYHKKVIIICNEVDPITKKIHGEFESTVANLLNNSGCPKCSGKYSPSTEEFIEKASILHNGYYDYTKTAYFKNNEKIIVTCPVHGDFLVTPNSHLSKLDGCPKCRLSKGEKLVLKYLDENLFSFEHQKSYESRLFSDSPNKKYVEIDFVLNLDDRKIWIEFNGEQHYKFSNIFHKDDRHSLERQIQRDNSIREYAKANNIEFLEIPWVDIDRIPEILEAFLYRQEDITTKIDIDYDNIQT